MEYQSIENFKKEREELNQIVLENAGLITKRFFNLDTKAYEDGAFPAKLKEALGLSASLVLRCDDCIKYHIIRCFEEGITDEELEEILAIGLIVGGSIVIPHLRGARKAWQEIKEMKIESKPVLFKRLMIEIEKILETNQKGRGEVLLEICRILHDRVAHYDWVGFYLTDLEDKLVLDAFVGDATEHTEIDFGQGICGQAADRKKTFVVQDVSRENNYLSCSINVKSEIVVPIMKGEQVLGELDIDSHILSPFDDTDKEFLEKICEKLVCLF